MLPSPVTAPSDTMPEISMAAGSDTLAVTVPLHPNSSCTKKVYEPALRSSNTLPSAKLTPSSLYWKAPLPPSAVTVTSPSFSPAHSASMTDVLATMATPGSTVTVAVDEQLLPSVTTTS